MIWSTTRRTERSKRLAAALLMLVITFGVASPARAAPPPRGHPADLAGLDLAAMSLRPADLEAEGVQEHGMANGLLTDNPATAGDFLRAWRGDVDGATTAALQAAAPQQLYLEQLAQTGQPWDASSGTVEQIVSYLFAFGSDAGASAAFPVLAEAWRSGGMSENATDSTVGDERLLVSGAGRQELGDHAAFQRVDVMFRSGSLIAGVSAERFAGLPIEPALVEALATRQQARIAEVRATGGPGLSQRTLRLVMPGENAIWDFYEVRAGQPVRQFDEGSDAFATRTSNVAAAGIKDEYRLEQQFVGSLGSSQGPLAFYSARLAAFSDANAASVYLQQAGDRLRQGNA